MQFISRSVKVKHKKPQKISLLLTGISLLLIFTVCSLGKLSDQSIRERSFDLSYSETFLTKNYSFQKNDLNNSIADKIDMRLNSLSKLSH